MREVDGGKREKASRKKDRVQSIVVISGKGTPTLYYGHGVTIEA